MELIDIIITTLSLVLLALVGVLLLSFIFYKMKSRNRYSAMAESGGEVKHRLREVLKPRKPQRYKVINENTFIPTSTNHKDRVNINGRYVVYNYLPVDYPLHRLKRFTKWSS